MTPLHGTPANRTASVLLRTLPKSEIALKYRVDSRQAFVIASQLALGGCASSRTAELDRYLVPLLRTIERLSVQPVGVEEGSHGSPEHLK